MNKLSIVTSSELMPEDQLNKIYLLGNDENSNLAYNIKNSDGEIIPVTISLESSDFRPLRCSEVANKLEEREWNVTERIYISNPTDFDNSEKKKKKDKPTEYIDLINSSDESLGITITNSSQDISEEKKTEFRDKYKQILDDMNKNEVYIYNSSRNTVDFIDNSVIFNAIEYDSDSYTNILSLNELVSNFVHPGVSCKVDLTIQYSKGENIINYDTTFEAFKYNDTTLDNSGFIEDINSEVILEYSNNVIKVMPKSRNINECIIRNCTLTYGNLG